MNKKSLLIQKALNLWRARVIEKEQGKCIITGSPLIDPPHHFIFRSQSKLLLLDPENGILLTPLYHKLIHSKGRQYIEKIIIAKKGKQWYNYIISQQKKEKQMSSFWTEDFIKKQIKKLQL